MGELTEIKKDPYSFICDYVESIYPKVGKKCFEIMSLMPVSIIIPDLPFGSKKVRSNIHCLFLAPSGSGKSSIAKLFENITLSPLHLESVTSARLESAIMQNPFFSLIVGDFARMSRDPVLIKVIEGLLGEEKSVSRKTMRKDIDLEAEGTALLCGISTDLSQYILSGLIFRTIPLLIGHSAEEHSQIGEHIKNKIGDSEENGKEEIIKKYYLQLAQNQAGKGKLPEVKSYNIPKKFKDKAYEEWDKLTQSTVKELGMNFFRELQEFFRILVAHAFLNSYNRKIENNSLTPTQEDFEVALKLMKQSIKFKFRLIRSESFAKGIKNAKQFKEILDSDKVPEQYKEILRNLVEIKGNKVIKR
ncbi:MAG: hypothetical protein ACTSXD_07065 [Candidatus Heimdallarchaeaceae archaeon]